MGLINWRIKFLSLYKQLEWDSHVAEDVFKLNVFPDLVGKDAHILFAVVK